MLEASLVVAKAVYKLDACVAGRFTQDFKSLEALSDAQVIQGQG